MKSKNYSHHGKSTIIPYFTFSVIFAISITSCESFHHILSLNRPIIRNSLTVLSGTSSSPNKRMGAERTHTRRKHHAQETEKITLYTNTADRFTSKYLKHEKQIAAAMGVETPKTRTVTRRKTSKADRKRITDNITKLLNENVKQASPFQGKDIADKETVFAKLSDEDLREAADVAKVPKTSMIDLDEKVRDIWNTDKIRSRVKANVLETGRDTISQYVKNLRDHQVLEFEDEQILGRHIHILAKWEEKRQELEFELERAPTFAEWAECVDTSESELKKQILRSRKAKHALVEASLRLVVTIARQTVKSGRGVNFKEACQEGIIGLNQAAERFDYSKGFRFSSYAAWWIRKYVQQNCVEQTQGPMRLPQNVMKEINNIRVYERVLKDELGRWPTDEEVAKKCDITVERLGFIRRSVDRNKMKSLDDKVKSNKKIEGQNSDVHEVVKDQGQSASDIINQQMLKEDVRRLIRSLSPKEQAVIRLRFGLDNGSPKSIKEIGKKFKVDDSKIKLIEKRAMTKLRQPYRSKSVEAYMPDL